MSSHLVETSEDDSFLSVARKIADLLNEGQDRTALADTPGSRLASECEVLLAEGNLGGLLDRLGEHINLIFNKLDGKDLECCSDILAHLASRVPPAELPDAVKNLVQALTTQVDGKAETRLQALVTLHNALKDPKLQLEVVLATLSFAKSANLAGQLSAVLPGRVDAWIKEWKLGPVQERKLCLAASDLLRASKKRKAIKDAYALTVRALQTFQAAGDADVAKVKPEAALAVADFIRNADLFQFDLLDNPVLAELASDPKYQPLYKLLTLVIDGDVKGLTEFTNKNKKVLEENRLNLDDVTVKTRIMALLALASKSTDISFAAVQSALEIEEGAVEAWVVRAIGKKLIEARIDQPGRRICIIKSTLRTFSQEQWGQLRLQLAAWKENVQSLLSTVGASPRDYGLTAPPTSRLQTSSTKA